MKWLDEMVNKKPESLRCEVKGRGGKMFEGECASVSLINTIGSFDILPEHENFVSIVQGEVTVREISGKVWSRICTRGVIRVTDNMVDVVFLEEKV